MLDGKMLVGVETERLMVRLNPDVYEDALEKEGCRIMDFNGKPMRGYVFVDVAALNTGKKLAYWLNLALDYNALAKPSKKKSGKK